MLIIAVITRAGIIYLILENLGILIKSFVLECYLNLPDQNSVLKKSDVRILFLKKSDVRILFLKKSDVRILFLKKSDVALQMFHDQCAFLCF
jgi:hypothetical protein